MHQAPPLIAGDRCLAGVGADAIICVHALARRLPNTIR